VEDAGAAAGIGTGCTRVVERVCASVGLLSEAASRFEPALDVARGGVLWAVPALLANGLLRHPAEGFRLPAGFYSLIQVFVLLGFMALARIRTVEALRYGAPGEWGMLLGLDRIPEVRTLREKIKVLAQPDAVGQWSDLLSREWMEGDPDAAGVLYVDGHVRLYHGSQTALPRRYVSRERLCLRGTTDYWVNDQQGRPFFVVTTPFTDGLLAQLRDVIVPRLLAEVPHQPSDAALKADPHLARFTLIFDREGYSPAFFSQMWEQRIACQTYHKYPKGPWALHEFAPCSLTLPSGETVCLTLAERGTRLSNGLWVREIRKLTDSGHQVALLSTDYRTKPALAAVHMFARWSQENFIKYMMQHFGIDKLVEYETVSADETKMVVNPTYRGLEGQIKKTAALLGRTRAKFSQRVLEIAPAPPAQTATPMPETPQAKLAEAIELLQHDLEELKTQRKNTPKHIRFSELPQSDQFRALAPTRKQFLDTIKMIAYRAETAMADILCEHLAHPDETRTLLRELFTTDADLLPNEDEGTLTVQLHHLANPASDRAIRALAQQLNDCETLYPGTNLQLIFKLVSDHNP
jgi:prepilin-type processing-associated H-X9-DG protein